MKKRILTAVILAALSVANCAFAAPASTFSDVPAKHWAYEAINKLAKAGIVSGTGNGNFAGDRILTRYEMAEIVANAMTKADNADAETKAALDKLAAEFATELKGLGVRVEAVEKKQGPLKITGFFNYRYEWVQHPKYGAASPLTVSDPTTDPARAGIADSTNTSRTSLWLFVDNQFDGKTSFHGLLQNESVGGRSTNAGINVLESFVTTKMGGSELAVGRFFPSIGMGFFGSPWMDGARLSFGNEVKVRLFQARLLSNPLTYGSATYTMADANFALDKNTDLSLGYVADSKTNYVNNPTVSYGNNTAFNKQQFKDIALGMAYKGIKNISLKSEYAINSSEYAKGQNNGSNAKAYFVTAKYKGANPMVPGTFGVRVEYKHAEAGFDSLSYAAPFEWNAPINWTQPPQGGYNDNIKGFEYGIEYTVAPRLLLDVRYNDLKTTNGQAVLSNDGSSYTSQNFATAQLTYLF